MPRSGPHVLLQINKSKQFYRLTSHGVEICLDLILAIPGSANAKISFKAKFSITLGYSYM